MHYTVKRKIITISFKFNTWLNFKSNVTKPNSLKPSLKGVLYGRTFTFMFSCLGCKISVTDFFFIRHELFYARSNTEILATIFFLI